MRLPVRRTRVVSCFVLAAFIIGLVLAAPPAVAEATKVEKLLPADSIAAFVIPDWAATQKRWKTTALFDLLQDEEVKAMFKPFGKTVEDALARISQLAPGMVEGSDDLLTGQSGVAILLNMGMRGPTVGVQVVLQPKNKAAALAFLYRMQQTLMTSANARVKDEPDLGSVCRVSRAGPNGEDIFYAIGERDGLIIITIGDKGFLAKHKDTVARIANGGKSLADNPHYAAARAKMGEQFEGWFYLGVFPWLTQNLPQAAMVTGMIGLPPIEGIIAGIGIEDRGFRTRIFIGMQRKQAGDDGKITEDHLKRVPKDVQDFSVGSVDLAAIYNKLTMLMAMIPGDGRNPSPGQYLMQFRQETGLNLSRDLLSAFGQRYVSYVPAKTAPSGAEAAFFIEVKNRKDMVARMTKVMAGLMKFASSKTGENMGDYLRVRTLEREGFTQIYPQSILPGILTPMVAVGDGWAMPGLGAEYTLAQMDYFLNHKGSILDNADYKRLSAKLPKGGVSMGYTDVGANFDRVISTVQLLADFAAAFGKVGARVGVDEGAPFKPGEVWGIDPGRFPSRELIRKKLFGSAWTMVYTPDGIALEQFSSVGPLPVPPRTNGGGLYSKVFATSFLSGMVMPAFARSRGEARAVVSMNNQRQIIIAIITYMEPNQGHIPNNLAELVPDYIDDPRVFIAPWDGNPQVMGRGKGLKTSYLYVGRVHFRDIGPNYILLYDRMPQNGMRTAAHFDGHTKRYREHAFQRKLAAQYKQTKVWMARKNFPGNRDQVKAFYEGRHYVPKKKAVRKDAKVEGAIRKF
jgi:Protein of unknown function (DUF3352)